MPDFSIPLSGLTAESTALSAIANNLSNQNTTGYKDTSVLFSDLFYQSLGTTGSGDPIQVGAGVEMGSMPVTVYPRQRQCDGSAHGCGHSRQRIFRGAELERHHRLHASGRFFDRLQQLPGDLRRTTGAGLSRGQWSGQYRGGDRAAATGRGDHQSADGDRERRD